jgi:hypothetical protein
VIFTTTDEGGKMMDPLILILSALTAGAVTAAQTVAGDAIMDAYAELKSLLQQKFMGKQSAEVALDEHETDPTTWEVPLKKALMQAQADHDEAIIEAAQKVMTLVNPQQVAMGKYNMQITGNVQGVAQGDYQYVEMTFGGDTKE